jgi:hypothetical protein
LRDEKPYLSRSGLKTKLRKDDVKDTMVDKMLRPGKPQELIGSLLTANIIEPYEHGWIVIAEAHASAMRLKIAKV